MTSTDYDLDGPRIVVDHEVDSPEVGSKLIVKVTRVQSPGMFYVHLPFGELSLEEVTSAFVSN